ncbi:MAG: iron-containing alcohol dehydrogenase [Chitinispirillaceae bacterium]|nr:iron-containing alcohol dehydrogenase [Chitinispirillaceae bacterium]
MKLSPHSDVMDPVAAFSLARPPKIIFGAGSLARIGAVASALGNKSLLVVSRSLMHNSLVMGRLAATLDNASVEVHAVSLSGEPSPDLVDTTVKQYADRGITVVISMGGGSAIDAGKAVSAMLPLRKPVTGFLEEVGSAPHPGTKIPFIAVPTTAGTGSEASANAVLSTIGNNGFKKSLRHEALTPDVALVDPELALTCPPEVTAACGMDALTQLLEAYVSPKASPMTDALCESAFPNLRSHLFAACTDGTKNLVARSHMAYAALVSGIALANAGLGVVHGCASPIGGYVAIPHGVVCGTLLAPATAVTVQKLFRENPDHGALAKYAHAGTLISGKKHGTIEQGCDGLITTLHKLTEAVRIPRLSAYGISHDDIMKTAAGASSKNNPAPLSEQEIHELLLSRL